MNPADCRVAAADAVVLRAAQLAADDLDAAQDTVLVRVRDEAGREGIGEADAPAELVRDLVLMADAHGWSRGLAGVVVGRDPLAAVAAHETMYQASIWHGRRGLGIHAISAVDIALYDLAGKQTARPVHTLLGGARRRAARPYATVWPGPARDRSLSAIMDDIAARVSALTGAGFRAVKVELLPDLPATDRDLVACVRQARAMVGPDMEMLVDFGYRWQDWRAAQWLLNKVDECDVWLAEATLQHDDLDGHARLSAAVSTRIGGAEMAATRWECREWIERGRVAVLQPDVNRCGGLTELRRIADMAALYGVSVVPHGWKTGITAAATRHLQVTVDNMPYVEMLAPGQSPSPLRARLVGPEPAVVDGLIDVGDEPGLGVVVDEQVVRDTRVGARP
jgi:L-rhamnonate dehydratase